MEMGNLKPLLVCRELGGWWFSGWLNTNNDLTNTPMAGFTLMTSQIKCSQLLTYSSYSSTVLFLMNNHGWNPTPHR